MEITGCTSRENHGKDCQTAKKVGFGQVRKTFEKKNEKTLHYTIYTREARGEFISVIFIGHTPTLWTHEIANNISTNKRNKLLTEK